MKRKTMIAALLAAAVVIPVIASAQGVPGGIERGSREGERAAGPVGAVVGGVVGGVNGVLGIDQRPRFNSYVVERHIPLTPTKAMSGSARTFPETASPITTCHRNMACATTATRSSMVAQSSSTRAHTGSWKLSN